MALLGPMVVVSEASAADLLASLSEAGAFPIIETSWTNAPAAIAEVQPVAVAIARSQSTPPPKRVRELTRCIQSRPGPVTPVIAIVEKTDAPAMPGALPIPREESTERFIARLRSALRVRTIHATVLRRARSIGNGKTVPIPSDLLADATVLCVGRGASYPSLSVAIGERVGIVGAFSIEAAARYLNNRDIDGLVIGDGLTHRVIDALLSVLSEDPRFRDLPIGLLSNAMADDDRLPNLFGVDGDALRLVDRLLPFVGLRAFESYLKRVLKSLDSEGIIEPETGLLNANAFWRDLEQTVAQTTETGGALSIARFSFEGLNERRAINDAARLFSRLVRNIDFACREQDGSILAAFTETDLRSAHVVARRIAAALRQTMISCGRDRQLIKPTITLATFKPTDNVSTLVARVGAYPKIASPH
jgi:hypothetical protein